MANEFVHATVGTSLTQIEFEAVGLHVLNSQATGDLIYASSASQLSRIGIGAANTVLHVVGTTPTWSATLAGLTLTSPTINGTIATTGLTLPAVTLGGTVTVNGQDFDAGASFLQIKTTGANVGLRVDSTNEGAGGGRIILGHVSSSPAIDDVMGSIAIAQATSIGAWTYNASLNFYISNITGGSEATHMHFNLMTGNADNTAMTLSGAGGLAVDLDNGGTDYYVSLFDKYDDAMVIRQGIQENNRELLADIGVFDRKDTGSGYMMKIQPMVRLLAGGIYQTRELIDQTKEELVERIEGLENKLMLLGAG